MLAEEREKDITLFIEQMADWFVGDMELEIKWVHGGRSSIIELYPMEKAVGSIIGRQGIIINSIKNLLECYGRRIDHEISVHLIKPKMKRRRDHRQAEENESK